MSVLFAPTFSRDGMTVDADAIVSLIANVRRDATSDSL